MAERVRFGIVNETVLPGRAWIDHVRRLEDSGIDVLLVRDHLSAEAMGPQYAPFSALATAAASTDRLRVGTMVLANDFRHPAVVAHEAATLSALSGGRFELGMGAGWYEPEFRAMGLPFDQAPERIARLRESVEIVTSLLRGDKVDFAGRYYTIEGLSLASPPGNPPRLLIGAGGRKMLSFAARSADIVGILPAPIRAPDEAENPADRSPEAFARKVDVIRREAGPERFAQLELCAFVTIRVTDRRRETTEQLMRERGWTGLTPEDVWRMPTVFVGSPEAIRDSIRERAEGLGLSYLVCSDDDVEVVKSVVVGF